MNISQSVAVIILIRKIYLFVVNPEKRLNAKTRKRHNNNNNDINKMGLSIMG